VSRFSCWVRRKKSKKEAGDTQLEWERTGNGAM
jgi:hypothetical protein